MTEPAGDEALSFEAAMDRLENLVEQMESAQLPLAELILRYEEGNRLLAVCAKQLDAAEKRVQTILKGPGGKPQLADFNASEVPAVPRSSKPASRVVDDTDEEISLF